MCCEVVNIINSISFLQQETKNQMIFNLKILIISHLLVETFQESVKTLICVCYCCPSKTSPYGSDENCSIDAPPWVSMLFI